MCNGENPLLWDCEKQGCFNKLKRPKLEVFADCFPRRINFGDVDGIVEMSSRALLLEWKSLDTDLRYAQRLMMKNLSRTGVVTGLAVWGNAQNMDVYGMELYRHGIQGDYLRMNMDGLKDYIRRWAAWADGLPKARR